MDSAFIYSYYKLRKSFGRQPLFCETPPVILDSIDPDYNEQRLYGLCNPVSTDMQTTVTMSEQYINTKCIARQDQGTNHAEGGWPKDITFNDEEATARYRRRLQHDDMYIDAVLSTKPHFEHLIDQNNAIEMYNMYFKEMKPEIPVEKYSVNIRTSYKDVFERPIASIAWSYDNDPKLVVAYCNKKYSENGSVNNYLEGNIWNLENNNEPSDQFLPPTACWQIICLPSNPKSLIGGLEDGRVCIFDIREKKEAVQASMMHLSHRDPVSALLFLHSRQDNEFFSGSSDGQCIWWDIRNISEPIDSLIMSITLPPQSHFGSLANAEGVSALQFDRSVPSKFFCGTDTGLVINVNRKGKSHKEVMSTIFNAHYGPVRAVHRSPCTSKIFITCGDWTVKIWSEDVHSSPIIYGKAHRMQVSDVAWSPQKLSSYMSICFDGKFRLWDLLRRHCDPIVTIPISKYPLLKMKPNEQGNLVAIGDIKGAAVLVSLSEKLVISDSKDKILMNQNFEREIRKEHILETRVKEIRFKLRENEAVDNISSDFTYDDTLIKNAEDEFKKIVADELKLSDTSQISSKKSLKMRKR